MQQTRYTDQITAAEWRWVTIWATALSLLTLLPFVLVPFALPDQDATFMGILHDPEGTVSGLASMRLGERGEWLWRDLHTPEPQNGAISDVIYVVLGHIARFVQLEPLALFHIARVLAAMFMFHAFYVLSAAIWSKINTRRLFWFVVSVGAGLGWIAAPLLRQFTPDIEFSAIFPFHVALASIHLPLAVGCLAFLAGAMLDSMRPGSYAMPGVSNSGLSLIVFSVTLALLYPQAFIPLGITYALLLALDARRRSVYGRNAQWFMWFIVPPLPLLAYILIVTVSNPVVMEIWQLGSAAAVPSPLKLLIALGLPLIFALPGLWRALRRFEPDGSAFMLVWLAAMLLLAYLMPVIRGKYLLGLMLPIAYFVARSAEDFWFPRVTDRRWRWRLIAAAVPLIVASNAIVLIIPLGTAGRLTLPADYGDSLNFLHGRPAAGVVVASGPVGLWLPSWTGQQTVYASSRRTLDASAKAAAIRQFYGAQSEADCDALLNGEVSKGEPFRVRYVLLGPLERAIGDAALCLADMIELARFGTVSVYLATH
jgi:hypothetical protein